MLFCRLLDTCAAPESVPTDTPSPAVSGAGVVVAGSEVALVTSALVPGEGASPASFSAWSATLAGAVADFGPAAPWSIVCDGTVLSPEGSFVFPEAPAAASAIPESNCGVAPGELGTGRSGLSTPKPAWVVFLNSTFAPGLVA